MSHQAGTRLSVEGMKCGGCIATAKKALADIPGYKDAEFDLKTGVAVIYGDIDAEAAARAITAAGYPAVPKGD